MIPEAVRERLRRHLEDVRAQRDVDLAAGLGTVAGANGAGKTTFARQFLPALHPGVLFLNVDEVQVEDTAFEHPISAGRELLRRLAERERWRASFALGTTLSSAMYARRIRVEDRTGSIPDARERTGEGCGRAAPPNKHCSAASA
jgi:ABC-type Na+ transport system ATPase subunit NatA